MIAQLRTYLVSAPLLAFASPALAQDGGPDPYPASSALEEGVSPDALAALDELVQALVEEEEIVGAELLVLKNGRSILHEAYGMGDREAGEAMRTGSVFCVRSMTKPVVGAAVLMLVDEDRLELDDPVAKYLPSFDVEASRDITVEQLLTHTSGLPMSLILGKDLYELHEAGGIRAVADLGAGHELLFEPGSGFHYSDQGTDTLTALVEVVSGMPAAEFVRTRVLDPLGMSGSTCVLGEDHPLRARALPKYVGSRGAWTRLWSPDDRALFPFFLGSQGLYSTLESYAQFLELWAKKGRVGGERLLASRYVRRALLPGPHPMDAPTGFPELRANYGYLMQLWTRGDAREVVAFGHTGSDGTHAWVLPEQKAMVLYFTQSRNNTTGLRVEEALGQLFLGAPFDPNEVAPPFEDYLGYYWEGEGDLYRAIVRDGDDLALEIMGKGVVPLTYAGGDRWKFRPNPGVVLAFDRSETGEVTGYHIDDHVEYRFDPHDPGTPGVADLPTPDELAERVAQAHGVARFETLGALRIEAALNMEKLGITGEVSSLYVWPDRYRIDTTAQGSHEHIVHDGREVRQSSSTQPPSTLEGSFAAQARLDSPFITFGDWRAWYPGLLVVQRVERGGHDLWVARTGDTSAPARTFYVDVETGHLRREERVTFIETMGRIGQRITYDDFREVSGAWLPHRSALQLANPLIGDIVTTVTEIEVGAEVPPGVFDLEE